MNLAAVRCLLLWSQDIIFLQNFCDFIKLQEDLVKKVFFNVKTSYKYNDRLKEQDIFEDKNNNFYELHLNISSKAVTYRTIATFVVSDEMVYNSTTFINSFVFTGMTLQVLLLKIPVQNIHHLKLWNGTSYAVKKIAAT